LASRILRAVFATTMALLLSSGTPRAADDTEPLPTPQQLNVQISILKDEIQSLTKANDQYRQRAELADQTIYNAYLEMKKREFGYYGRLMDVNVEVFFVQKIASYVVLFLVFIVVTSGVLFSGYQLWKSVAVAGVQTSNDLEISAAKVRVTSSVVGIVVLAISLAFLFIYTHEVYTIKSLAAVQSEVCSTSTAGN
jgi:hypothetical protein